MNIMTITNRDDELLGVFQTESEPQYIESEIEKVYKKWEEFTDECEIEDLIRLQEYFENHLPDIGVYPIEIGNVQISGG